MGVHDLEFNTYWPPIALDNRRIDLCVHYTLPLPLPLCKMHIKLPLATYAMNVRGTLNYIYIFPHRLGSSRFVLLTNIIPTLQSSFIKNGFTEVYPLRLS